MANEYNETKTPLLVKHGDKYVMEFDEIPALIHVSQDGHGANDITLVNGELIPYLKGVTIHSGVDELTEVETTFYVIK